MTSGQMGILIILAITVVMFLWGKWRHDMVAIGGLLACVLAGLVPASGAFLTPIGHQNNTLILGPGGLRFGDYWKLGLPLEILVFVICMLILPVFWPL